MLNRQTSASVRLIIAGTSVGELAVYVGSREPNGEIQNEADVALGPESSSTTNKEDIGNDTREFHKDG